MSFRPRTVTQTYKKVLFFAGASHAAGVVIHNVLSTGVDSIAQGQVSPTDPNVATGSVISYIEIQHASANIAAAVANFIDVAIQYTNTGQAPIDPRGVGGGAQRNQVMHLQLFSVGQGQNSNRVFRFKVPAKYQRVRESSSWFFSVVGSAIWSDAIQVIYKTRR